MIFRRTTRPPQLVNYRAYKKYLRIDFLYRCCYCGITEISWGSDRNFVVEHFRPKVRFPSQIARYENLYYACNRCNDFKGNAWPIHKMKMQGFRFADPCKEDIFKEHLREDVLGNLWALTQCGEYTKEHINLNRIELVVWRRERRNLITDILESEQLIKQLNVQVGVPKVIINLVERHIQLCSKILTKYK